MEDKHWHYPQVMASHLMGPSTVSLGFLFFCVFLFACLVNTYRSQVVNKLLKNITQFVSKTVSVIKKMTRR